jgi:hypothetical protein
VRDHHRTWARRTLAPLTALVLTGTTLALGTGPAAAAPGDPDITTPSDGSTPLYVDSATTDATGAYALTDLDPVSLDMSYDGPEVDETSFRLYFEWEPSTPAQLHATGYVARGLGGSKSPRAAGAVTVPPGGTAVAPTQALPAAGGVIVKVVGPSGAPVDFGAGVVYVPGSANPFTAYVENAHSTSDDQFYPDGPDADTEPDAPRDGLVYLNGLEPGRYAVEGYGEDRDETTDVWYRYLSRFFGGDGTYAGAKPVTVAAGSFTRLTIQVTDRMTPLEEPRVIGDSGFGSRLKVDPGTWLGGGLGGGLSVREEHTDYSYQWLRGSKVVGTGPTYKLSKKDKGKKIRALVTAYRGDWAGTAATDPTSKVGEKSKATARRVAGGKVAATVEVAKKKLRDKLGTPKGKVVLVTKDGAFASAKVKLKNGKALLSPKMRYAGQKLLVLYLGGGKLGSDTGAVKGR